MCVARRTRFCKCRFKEDAARGGTRERPLGRDGEGVEPPATLPTTAGGRHSALRKVLVCARGLIP